MEVPPRNLTRVTLELGGRSAAVVLPDADVEATVAGDRWTPPPRQARW